MERAPAGHAQEQRGRRHLQRSAILGLPVILAPTGRRLGQVSDLALNPDGDAVLGVVVEGGWTRGRRLLDRQAVAGWGPDALVATAEAWLAADAGLHAATLSGKPVLVRTGRELGQLDDLEFDPASGSLTGFGLSAGLVSDLLHGKTRLAASLRVGEAVLWLENPVEHADQARGTEDELS